MRRRGRATCALAHRLGEALCDLPFYREEDHLATSRLIVVGLLSGAWDEAIELSELFRAGLGAGRSTRSPATCAPRRTPPPPCTHCAGDDEARESWTEVVQTLRTPGRTLVMIHFGEFFDALVLLHRGQADDAVELLADAPEEFVNHYNGMWRAWYASVWGEAAVLAGRPGRPASVSSGPGC